MLCVQSCCAAMQLLIRISHTPLALCLLCHCICDHQFQWDVVTHVPLYIINSSGDVVTHILLYTTLLPSASSFECQRSVELSQHSQGTSAGGSGWSTPQGLSSGRASSRPVMSRAPSVASSRGDVAPRRTPPLKREYSGRSSMAL